MTSTININTRVQLLGTDDTDVLSTTYVDLMVDDAKSNTKITDESSKALRYYTCYLIATNWESIGAVASREGVRYRAPDPDKYLALYKVALQDDIVAPDDSIYAAKVSTNEGNIFDDEGVMEKGDYSNQF